MTLEQRIQRLEDIEAIRYLQAKYQRCVDTRSFNELADCFADDVVSGYGNGEMSFSGKDNVIKFLMGSMALGMPSSHMIHGGEIDIDGDTATAKWMLQDDLSYPAYNINIHGAAIYKNTYAKIDGVWKIKTIGYNRLYEYRDGISQTQAATFGKTSFLDAIKNGDVEAMDGYNKTFKMMSMQQEQKK